jgi:magnesium transporter
VRTSVGLSHVLHRNRVQGTRLVTDHRRPTIRSLVRARRPRPPHRDASNADGLAIADEIPTEPPRSKMVDSAIYVDGKRVASPKSLTETFERLRRLPDSMAWIGLYRPEDHEVGSLASEFQLHPLAVEDAIHAHQRPKIERYDDTLFVVLRPARYMDDIEEVEFGEVHIFVGPSFVLTVRHSEAPEFRPVRRRLESQPDLLRRGPEAVLYAVLDKVVDGYYPVVVGLANDIDEIEAEVFSGDPKVSRRIYELSREVAEFQRATGPLVGMIAALSAGFVKYQVDEELQRYLRDVDDHLTQIVERVDEFRQALRDMLTVNATLVAQQQNEEMRSLSEASNLQNEEVKKISAWAAILFAPTLIGTIYGMNFEHMPELGWAHGYALALSLMVLTCLTLYVVFKRRDWL